MFKWLENLFSIDIQKSAKEDDIKHENLLKEQKLKEEDEDGIDTYLMMEELIDIELDLEISHPRRLWYGRKPHSSSKNDDYSSIDSSSSMATTSLLMSSTSIDTSSPSCDIGSFDCGSF